jgi:hypothetical protein
MTRTIKLSQIGDYAEEQYEKLLRVAVLETDKRLKASSPVDTGRLRASWQIGENTASGGVKPPGNYPDMVLSRKTVHGALPPDRLNYSKEKLGNVYSIHNNLPYVEPVLMGDNLPRSWQGRWRSKDDQIERGYPLVIAKDMQAWIRQQADKIGRTS